MSCTRVLLEEERRVAIIPPARQRVQDIRPTSQYPVTIDDTIGEIQDILRICIMTSARCSCYRTIHECARASCTPSMCIVISFLADIQP